MASVEKRQTAKGATTYIVKWRTPDGRHRTRGGFTTKRTARTFAAKAESAVSSGVDFDPGKGKMTFREAGQLWLESRKADTRNDAANHRYALAPAETRRGDGKTLGIDAVFGGYPLNKITRAQIQAWVNGLTEAGKQPSTVRHAFWTVRMVLAQAVVDGRIPVNPADHVKLPTERGTGGGKIGIVDRAQFLTAAQVSALVDATPWPYAMLVHLAAWSGLRAAELGGLQIEDLELPLDRSGFVRVERSAAAHGLTKTDGSLRRVPLPAHTTDLLRDYLAVHPRRAEPTAPLFPGMVLVAQKPTGVRATPAVGDVAREDPKSTRQRTATRQASALADLSVAEAATRITLDWTQPLRHATFYKAVYRPAVLRANRIAAAQAAAKTRASAKGSRTASGKTASEATVPTPPVLPPGLKFHSLRHTYASLCAAAGISVREVAEFMGHANATTTEHIYTHRYRTDDHAGAMGKLGAMAATRIPHYGNVIPLRG